MDSGGGDCEEVSILLPIPCHYVLMHDIVQRSRHTQTACPDHCHLVFHD